MTLQESISSNTNQDVKQPGGVVLYQTPYLRFLRNDKYYHLNCLDENILEKRELVSFIQYARSVYRVEPYESLLIQPGKGSNVDIDSWSILTKVKFEKAKSLRIAFVSSSLYQGLLLKRLQILNDNVKVFADKKSALKWLQN